MMMDASAKAARSSMLDARAKALEFHKMADRAGDGSYGDEMHRCAMYWERIAGQYKAMLSAMSGMELAPFGLPR
jgi:hypothetical protein